MLIYVNIIKIIKKKNLIIYNNCCNFATTAFIQLCHNHSNVTTVTTVTDYYKLQKLVNVTKDYHKLQKNYI